MVFWKIEPTENVVQKLITDWNDVEGLSGLLDDILGLVGSKVYEDLVCVSLDDINDPDVKMDRDEELSLLEKYAFDNLSNFPLRLPLTPLVGIKDFLVIYSFIASLYYLRLGHKLNLEERNKVFYSDVATRIVLLLEDFDSTMETPEPTPEFFKKLGKIKWYDKKVKKLFKSVRGVYFMLIFNNWQDKDIHSFDATENAFLLLLAGCSAVMCGRDKINSFDVITANKTYLKLINTDIIRLM